VPVAVPAASSLAAWLPGVRVVAEKVQSPFPAGRMLPRRLGRAEVVLTHGDAGPRSGRVEAIGHLRDRPSERRMVPVVASGQIDAMRSLDGEIFAAGRQNGAVVKTHVDPPLPADAHIGAPAAHDIEPRSTPPAFDFRRVQGLECSFGRGLHIDRRKHGRAIRDSSCAPHFENSIGPKTTEPVSSIDLRFDRICGQPTETVPMNLESCRSMA
jgi:hypothetical protein